MEVEEGGGDLGNDVLIGKLPNGDVPPFPPSPPPLDCCFEAKVGVNSGPSSNDKNLDESKDSSSSRWKLGVDRY